MVERLIARALLVPMLLSLVACTASWQAPLETRRGAESSRSTAPPASSRPPAVRPARGVNHGGAARSSTYHRVRRGETLYSIAWDYGRDFGDLARWNGIRSPYTIYPGQMLRLKPRVRPTSTARRAPAYAGGSVPSTAAKPASAPKAQPKPSPRSAPAPVPQKEPVARKPAGPLRWQWPVQGRLLSRYSSRDAARKGLKLGGAVGKPIRAAESGRVVYSGSGLIGYGRLIIIKHNDRYLSAYGHNSRLLVKEGEAVKKGEQIADMGTSNTGVAMLHFEIRKNGRPIDPLSVLPRRRN